MPFSLVAARIIINASIQKVRKVPSAPDYHLSSGPHRGVNASALGHVGEAGGCPTVGAGVISTASVHPGVAVIAAPDDHFAAGPHGCVRVSASRYGSGARAHPSVVG